MKNLQCSQHTFFSLLFILISVHFTYAQKGVQPPIFKAKTVTDTPKRLLEERFSQHEVFELPTRELSRLTESKSKIQFELKLDKNRSWKMTLFDSHLYAEDYVTRVLTKNGIVTEPRQSNTVFKGYLDDNYDHEIRLTIAEGFVFGFVNDGTDEYYIEPLQYHDLQANPDHFVVYKSTDVVTSDESFCGVTDVQQQVQDINDNHKNAALACLELELAQATDYSMFQRYGSTTNVNLYLDGIMNVVVTRYDDEFAEQISIVISERFIVNCTGCDPWTSSTNYNFIFPDFQTWGMSASGFMNPFDLSSLWTTRDIGNGDSSGAVGVAFAGTVCEDSGMSIIEDYSTNMANIVLVVTHELGHNFGCFHNYEIGTPCQTTPGRSSLIMDPTVSSATTWSFGSEPCTLIGGSYSAVNNHVATRTCLSNCTADACTNTPIDSFEIVNILPNSIDIAWNDIAAPNYQIRYRLLGTSNWLSITSTAGTTWSITGLTCNTQYEIQVRPSCGGGTYGPQETRAVETPGIDINALNVINCGGGTYDLEIIIDTDDASAGGMFDLTLGGNTSTQTYAGTNPQIIIIPNLPTDGISTTLVSVTDGACTESLSYTVPRPECVCTPIQTENFDACTLPSGWTNTATGANPLADWDFGPSTYAVNTPGGNFDGTCMAFFDDDAYDSDGGEVMTLTSPPVDITGFDDVTLEFDYNFFAFSTEIFSVDVFDGTGWVNVLTQTGNNCGPWGCTTPKANINLNPYLNTNFQVAFTFDDNNEWGWFIALDNFNICGYPNPCFGIDPNFIVCDEDVSNYDLTQQDTIVNTFGSNVLWYDGQPSSGIFIPLAPATAVDLNTVNELWAIIAADGCVNELQINYQIAFPPQIIADADTVCNGGVTQLCAASDIDFSSINWTDDSGADLGTADCIIVAPTTTTTYTAYTNIGTCTDTIEATIVATTDTTVTLSVDVGGICESEDIMNYDLTQFDTNVGGLPGTTTVTWYDGQPSAGGTNITPTANSTDLSGMPDIWAYLVDPISNCGQEIDLTYQFDLAPIITCPANISVSSDPDVCGAVLTIPPLIVMDDSITILPVEQTIFMPYITFGQLLQFDFTTSNLDISQPVSIDITVIGDTNGFGEYYDIFDESGVFIARIGETGFTCGPLNFTYIIPVADLINYVADGIITFTASPSSGVGTFFCTAGTDEGVTMNLSYTSLADLFISVTNDYNTGGADASDFYLPGTTVVTYTVTDGCNNVSTCAIEVNVGPSIIQGTDFNFTACGDLMNYDLTQLDTNFGGTMGSSTVDWYDGQPSTSGTNIPPPADSVDLTSMPDIWALVTDNITGCSEEINLVYELDFPPVLTCPTNISVSSDTGICGATLTIPPLIVMDDSITPLPEEQTIFIPHTTILQTLQFDFDGSNLDTSQPVSIDITVIGDTNGFGEYYDIFDENGNFITRIGETGTTCGPLNFTYTIPAADLANYVADGIITFTATPASAVGTFFCTTGTDEGVTMDLSYTPLSVQYLTIENDYTNGGIDASGFYTPGTTTVTYTVTDGCGNVSTCSTDVTVSPGTTTDFFDILTNADTLCTGGMAELCLDIPDETPNSLYAIDLNNTSFSDISRYIVDPLTNTVTLDNTFIGPDLGERPYGFDLNPVDNTVYLLHRFGGSNSNRQLYTLDLMTGFISNIGQVISSTGNLLPQDMTFDNAGNLYAVFNNGELHTIDYSVSPPTTTLINISPALPSNGGVGLTYNFDNNTLLYATGTGANSLYEININTGISTLLTTFTTSNGCPGQAIEYIGNGIIIGSGTFNCNEIFTIDLSTNSVTSLLSPTGSYSSIKDMLYIPTLANGDLVWTDDMGNQIDTTVCINVMPTNTTTYTASYTLPNGCLDVSQITIATTGTNLAPTTFSAGICEVENIITFDLTQYDVNITDPNEFADWYIGQPSMGGTDITTTANSTDLTAMPDIWALVTDSVSNCTQEFNLIYDIDNSPVITCPTNITLNNDPDTCGAFVSIPLATATDDNLTPLPDVQSVSMNYVGGGIPLQFGFSTTAIDLTQPVTATISAIGDLDSSTEYYEVFDENGTSLVLLNGMLCTPNVFTYTIPASDLAAFAADNIINFTATPTFQVDPLCGSDDRVEIELSYTGFSSQYVSISNDYNGGGADASDFYLPGTTTVTYVAIDGCGNTDTCSIDITVIQEITDGGDFNFTACGDLMNYDLTQLDANFGGTMGSSTVDVAVSWYDGQPSMSGTDITSTADSTDLTGMPDIWALIVDVFTGCLEEVNLSYIFDLPPTITCPVNIMADVEPGTCGANVTIPIATATDDGVTPLPDIQTVFREYTIEGQTLQFSFDGTNIDPSQSATLTVTVHADTGDPGEVFYLSDENGNLIDEIGNSNSVDCASRTVVYTISATDLAGFLANNIVTFFTTASPSVNTFCGSSFVEMSLSYTPLTPQFVTISNDYTNGGADASGYYTSGNTVVTFTATDGCGNMTTCTTTVTVNQPPVTGAPFTAVFCGASTGTDLTQLDGDLIVNPTDTILWFDGQPSAGGTEIGALATAYDLVGMPDIWVQVVDGNTGCLEERQIIYQLDEPPVLNCPADITVDALPGICGADVTIPPLTFTDDNVTPLPDGQIINIAYETYGQILQFDFDGSNIDITQAVTVSISAIGDLDSSFEYYEIFDENGMSLSLLNGLLCTPNIFNYTIPASDLATFIADNIITFIAVPTTSVDFFCAPNDGVEMNLIYTPITAQYVTVTNDYNTGGADASDFYPSGTTTVTYTAIDGCGNASTCTVDITVNQEPISFPLTADMDTLCLGGSTEICVPDGIASGGQLLGLEFSNWLPDAFLISSDLNTVSDDPDFVTPPLLPPAPAFGIYTAIDYNPSDGLYYLLAQNITGGINLYSVDITTGVTVDLGFISDNSNIYARGMSFDNAGNLYIANVTVLTPAITTNIEVIPAAALTNPVPTPTFLTNLPWDNASGMTYNFDSNTIYYASGNALYELDLSGNILNGPISYTSPLGCDAQSLEYMGNGVLYGGTCGQIFSIDPTTGATIALANHNYDFFDLLYIPSAEFTWTDDAGNIVYTGNETCINVSLDETTTYTASYENNGCFYEGNITINVFDPIANNPTLGFCDYEDISNIDLTIYNTDVNPDNALVEWYDGDPENGGTPIATPTMVDLNTIGDLWALVTEGGCTATVDVTLLIYATQAVTLNAPADVCEYEAPLSFSATPLPGTFTGDVAEYTTTAGAGFTDNGDGTATLDPALAGAGIYDITYTYTNIYGCVTSQTVSVEIFDQPTATANANSIICDGDDIMLTETGGEATTWTWTTDGTGVFEDANAQQTMVTGATDGETFTVSISNDDGCVNSDQVTVVFEMLSTANDPNLVYCANDDITNIDLTEYNNDVNAGTNGEIINWYDGNPEAGGTLLPSPTAVDLNAVNDLWASVTDASGCTVSVDVTLTINAIPTASIDINTPCEGEDIILSETDGNATSWIWTTNGTGTFDNANASSPTVSGASEGDTFTVTVSNDDGCTNTASATATFLALPSANDPMLEYCEDDAISVDLTTEDANVNANASITWYDGDPNDSGAAIASADNVDLTTVNDLWALVTDANGCTSTIDISVNILTLPEVVLNNPGNTCTGGSLLVFNVFPLMGTFTSTATAGFTDNNNGTASLNPAIAGAGMYDVTFTYIENGCQRDATVSVEVYDEPNVFISTNNPVCNGENFELSETGGDAVEWYWVAGSAVFNNNTIQNPTVFGASDGETFTVFIEDANGCTSSASVTASIGTLPVANDPMFAFCAEDDISNINLDALSNQVNPLNNGETLAWYDGQPGGLASTVISPAENADLTTVSDLWALVTTSDGCTAIVDVTVSINPAITLAPFVNPPVCNQLNSGSIELNIMGGTSPYDYAWSNGADTGSGTGNEIEGIVLGLYNITVTDTEGCNVSTSVEVQEESCFFTISNSFFASDPCTCNSDQTENGAGDGTFVETVTVTGPPGIIIRASAASTGLDLPVPADFFESFSGRYRLEFNHLDRMGYVIYIEFSTDGGTTFTPATDQNGMQLTISNVCAYPVLEFQPQLIEFCETEPPINVNVIETSSDVGFVPIEGYPALSIGSGPQMPAPISFDPANLGGSVITFTGFYNYLPGTGMGGTLANPAVSLNACPTFVRVNIPVSQEPIAFAICGLGNDPGESLIDVDVFPDYETPENLMYRLNNGVFQTSDIFTVNGGGIYDMTVMDAITACTFSFEVSCLLLPIELTAFHAQCDNNNYLLTWKTATESGVSEFIVERSIDGFNFVTVGKVAAVGNSDTPQSYQFRDNVIQTGRYYYRLRILEFDGTETFSPLEVAECLKGTFGILDVFPNPTDSELSMIFEATNTDVLNLKLTDVLGRTMFEENITPQIGLNTKVMDMTALPAAVYFIVIDDGRAVHKVVRK